MPDVVSYTLNDLITIVDKDRRLAKEVLQKLPNLVTAGENEDVVFELETPVAVPSLAKLRGELQIGGLEDMSSRILTTENVLTGVIQELTKLGRAQGELVLSPYWQSLDFTDNNDGRTNDPLWRANVADGFVRFPYEAFDEKPLDRKYDTQGVKSGGVLLPPFTENIALEKRYTAGNIAKVININAYPTFTRSIGLVPNYYSQYYWGYYYASYYWYLASYYLSAAYRTMGVSGSQTLQGSTAAQTFRLSTDRIVVGIDLEVLNPGSTRIAANPSILIVETEQGMPMFSKVIVAGSLVDNANAANTSTSATTSVQFKLTKPVLLKANTSYAIVTVANNTWNVGYSDNTDNTGGVFYTQDGQYWSSDLQKDMCFILRIADFGEGTTSFTIDLNALSLPGGIASLNYKKAVDAPVDGDINIEIDINNNGNWSPLATMAEIQSLPTYCPLRAVYSGSRYAMPLLNTEISKIVAFRPATTFRYISKDRTFINSQTLRVAYNLFSYDDTDPSEPMHSFAPRLKLVDGPGTTITPLTFKADRSADGIVTKIEAVFSIPSGATTYRHDLIGTTRTANTLFDITSTLEML